MMAQTPGLERGPFGEVVMVVDAQKFRAIVANACGDCIQPAMYMTRTIFSDEECRQCWACACECEDHGVLLSARRIGP